MVTVCFTQMLSSCNISLRLLYLSTFSHHSTSTASGILNRIYKTSYYSTWKIIRRMEPISSLTSSLLSPDQIRGLSQQPGITKMIHLVQEENKTAVMNGAHLSLADYEELKEQVNQQIQPQTVNATMLGQLSSLSLRSSGIHCLDEVLEGGLAGGEVLEIFGDIGTGKTQISLAISAHTLKCQGSVAYFDCKCNFSATRLLQFVNGEREDLRRIKVIQPSSMVELLQDFEEMKGKLMDNHDGFFPNLKLMIFDSVPMILYSAVDEDVVSWRYYQETFAKNVAQLSELNNGIVVVFVNHSVSSRPVWQSKGFPVRLDKEKPPIQKAAMGSAYWGHIPNFRLQLLKDPIIAKKYNAILQKSSRTRSGQEFSFTIDTLGINCNH